MLGTRSDSREAWTGRARKHEGTSSLALRSPSPRILPKLAAAGQFANSASFYSTRGARLRSWCPSSASPRARIRRSEARSRSCKRGRSSCSRCSGDCPIVRRRTGSVGFFLRRLSTLLFHAFFPRPLVSRFFHGHRSPARRAQRLPPHPLGFVPPRAQRRLPGG